MAIAVARRLALKQYYTDASEVCSAMTDMLGSVQGLTVLEPSVGNGALLRDLNGIPKRVDAVDIDVSVLSETARRFPEMNLRVHHADFIDLFVGENLFAGAETLAGQYDAVISNPPFGLYFSPEYRKRLKSVFPDLYVRESYGLFFVFSLMKLKEGGRYVFLVPDTFLTSKNHLPLRQYLLRNGLPSHIVRFPSKRFETVNFGYGNLCIIAGNKGSSTDQAELTWVEAFTDAAPLLEQEKSALVRLTGADLRKSVVSGWRSSIGTCRPELHGWTTLGELADCKTGIYTGDNEQFIGFDPHRISKRLNGHPIDWGAVHLERLSAVEREIGLGDGKKYVPLIRGGHRAFNQLTAWGIRWDAEALQFYKLNKKARLQNARFYFSEGLAVPMVTARRLSASLIDGAVFDQGVVGVFPHDRATRGALLLYLNSSIASELRNDIVNGSANNSANYLKRLPVPQFDAADLVLAREIVAAAMDSSELAREVCDNFVNLILANQGTPSNHSAAISNRKKSCR